MKRTHKIDPKTYYTVPQTVAFLREGGVGTPETVKRYCRKGRDGKARLIGKQIGPKKIWLVLGSSIMALRGSWGLDPSPS